MGVTFKYHKLRKLAIFFFVKHKMPILFPVNYEGTNLFSVKRDLNLPFTTLQNAAFCEKSFGKNRALYVHLAYKDADRFRKGSLHELYCLKASQHVATAVII